MEKVEMDLRDARILIVDDTQANLDVLCELLEGEGYRISMAPNGKVALRIAGRVKPDLILLDVMMPGMNGFEVCRRLKEDPDMAEIPVIFVTGQSETEAVVEGFQAGSVDYIVKPFKSEEVLARVQTHLKIDRLHRELEASNRQIREAADLKLAFLADMSHEMRTPLTSIKGYVDNMLDGIGGELSGRHQRNLGKVNQNVEHLLRLIQDILDLSRIDAGRIDVNPVRFEIQELIASCCDAIRPMLNEGVVLASDMADGIGEAHTDEARLRQILLNLMSNAAKFTEAGEVRVCVAREADSGNGEALSIAVSDTGIGIPAEELETIFEAFRQVKGTDKQQKGTGLGLAITRKLTGLLGGTIEVRSEVGKGSVFTVRVPSVGGSRRATD